MRSLPILLLLLVHRPVHAQSWAGRYALHHHYEQDRLELRPDGTFRLLAKGCTHRREARGSWGVERDTLTLNFDRIKGRTGGWSPYVPPDALLDPYRRGVLRGDSLDLRMTANHGYHPKLALLRLQGPVSRNWRK
jgi:hypothetical protein